MPAAVRLKGLPVFYREIGLTNCSVDATIISLTPQVNKTGTSACWPETPDFMNVLITDYDFPDVALELDLFRAAGIEVTTAQCKTEDQLIEAGRDADAFLLQYAPATRRVFEALPR